METPVFLLIALFVANAYADKIACAIRFAKAGNGKPAKEKLSGTVGPGRHAHLGRTCRKSKT